MPTGTFVVITSDQKPNVVELRYWRHLIGNVEEITSKALGADQASLAKVTLRDRDVLHYHKETEETYICLEGEGEIYLDGKIITFVPGTKVIIKPGTVHAASPRWGRSGKNLVFFCISSPAFSSEDVINDPRGQMWENEKNEEITLSEVISDISDASWVLMEFERKEALKISEFKGSEDFRRVLSVEKLLNLLDRAKEAAEKDSPFELSEDQYKAYHVVRSHLFTEKVKMGDLGYREYDAAIHREFRKRIATIKWDKIGAAREHLRRFIDKPEEASTEDIKNLRSFFISLHDLFS